MTGKHWWMVASTIMTLVWIIQMAMSDPEPVRPEISTTQIQMTPGLGSEEKGIMDEVIANFNGAPADTGETQN